MRHWLLLVVSVLVSAGVVCLCTAQAADTLPAGATSLAALELSPRQAGRTRDRSSLRRVT